MPCMRVQAVSPSQQDVGLQRRAAGATPLGELALEHGVRDDRRVLRRTELGKRRQEHGSCCAGPRE